MNKKICVSFTINKELFEQFKKISDKQSINRSKLIENYISSFITGAEEKNEKR